MPIRDGERVVNDLLTCGGTKPANDGRVLTLPALQAFHPEVQKRTQDPAAVFYDCVNTCNGTGYDHQNHEIIFWHVGLMLAEYVAGLIADKAKEGHCHARGKTNSVCSRGRALHLKMLARFKNDLRLLIKEIEDLEKEEPNWPKADAHTPQQRGQPPLVPPPASQQLPKTP
jgi:hypothetical protein